MSHSEDLTSMTHVVRLPETMARWPTPRRISPFHEEIANESAEWFRSFHAFGPNAQRAFDRCRFGRFMVIIEIESHAESLCRLTCKPLLPNLKKG